MEFAKNFKKIRKDNELSQEKIAEMLNVSRQAVTKWESGMGYPETEKLIEISELFQVSLDELMKGKKDTNYQENNISLKYQMQDDQMPKEEQNLHQIYENTAPSSKFCLKYRLLYPVLFALYMVSFGIAMINDQMDELPYYGIITTAIALVIYAGFHSFKSD